MPLHAIRPHPLRRRLAPAPPCFKRLRLPLALFLLLLTTGLLRAESASAPAGSLSPRGGRVGWARLVSDDPEWRRHTRSDHELSGYIKTRTSLNLDPAWHTADPARPDELTRYPLIFSTGLSTFQDETRRKNLGEYLNRGGFLIVDACINKDVTPNPDVFLTGNTAVFQAILPGSNVKPLPPDHAIYACFFTLPEKPPHTYHNAIFDPRWSRHPLYGVFADSGRLAAVISLSGLQCGWDRMPGPSGHTEQCMQMVVNIYVHAMTR
ncbi:MAG: twin-arginine translocation pathway signal [Rariglobus sp.]|nr:twin-arginine translocation pathway signal [Rariglobus sp.]